MSESTHPDAGISTADQAREEDVLESWWASKCRPWTKVSQSADEIQQLVGGVAESTKEQTERRNLQPRDSVIPRHGRRIHLEHLKLQDK